MTTASADEAKSHQATGETCPRFEDLVLSLFKVLPHCAEGEAVMECLVGHPVEAVRLRASAVADNWYP